MEENFRDRVNVFKIVDISRQKGYDRYQKYEQKKLLINPATSIDHVKNPATSAAKFVLDNIVDTRHYRVVHKLERNFKTCLVNRWKGIFDVQ